MLSETCWFLISTEEYYSLCLSLPSPKDQENDKDNVEEIAQDWNPHEAEKVKDLSGDGGQRQEHRQRVRQGAEAVLGVPHLEGSVGSLGGYVDIRLRMSIS